MRLKSSRLPAFASGSVGERALDEHRGWETDLPALWKRAKSALRANASECYFAHSLNVPSVSTVVG